MLLRKWSGLRAGESGATLAGMHIYIGAGTVMTILVTMWLFNTEHGPTFWHILWMVLGCAAMLLGLAIKEPMVWAPSACVGLLAGVLMDKKDKEIKAAEKERKLRQAKKSKEWERSISPDVEDFE